LVRNASIFNDRSSILECIASHGLSILSNFPQGKDHNLVKPEVEELVDHSMPWAYFDEASQNDGLFCKGGVFLHVSNSHSFKLKMGLGLRINNYAERIALKLLLTFAGEKGIRSL